MKLLSLFDDFQFCDSYEIDQFYKKIDTPTMEINLIYGLLEQWDYQLPSYQTIRSKIALNEIDLSNSPYHVLDQLYSR